MHNQLTERQEPTFHAWRCQLSYQSVTLQN